MRLLAVVSVRVVVDGDDRPVDLRTVLFDFEQNSASKRPG